MRVSLSLHLCLLLGAGLQASDKLEYNRDIRPILAENCFACHGPDSAARKGNLRLDLRELAIKKKAIIPGKPGESELLERVHSADTSDMMPPPESHKKLTDSQKKTLQRWIEQGAEYQAHWSLIAPTRPTIPAVKNTTWVKNPVDAFILASLERQQLTPAPEADRRSLARRVSFDLTGLPPSPNDVAEFIKDTSPNAYEKYVDKLLASVHWGEHRGRYWLDYSRFADTHGIHFDNYREMWAYRDWVIKAFNKNMPYNQFTIEQLAGDLLPEASLDQKIATGFSRNNITTNEGGAIDEEYNVLYARDRTETFGQVYLGMTTGCAVCHDHKYDPFSQRDFYSLSAFFNNTTQRAMDGNIKDTPPVMIVPTDEDRPRWNAIGKELTALKEKLVSRRTAAASDFKTWLKDNSGKGLDFARQLPKDQLAFQALLAEGSGSHITALVDGQLRQVTSQTPLTWDAGILAEKAWKTQDVNLSIPDAGDFDTKQPFSVSVWAKVNDGGTAALLSRMDENKAYRGWDIWIEGGRIGTHIVSQWMDDALKVISDKPVPMNTWVHIVVSYDGTAKAKGVRIYVNGEEQKKRIQTDKLKGSIKTEVPLKIGKRNTSSALKNSSLQDIRLYTRVIKPNDVITLHETSRLAWLMIKPLASMTDPDKEQLFNWWLPAKDQQYRELLDNEKNLRAEESTIKNRGTVAHVMQEKPNEALAHILKRGEYDNRLEPVKPETPKLLPTMASNLPRNRLGLAQWLLQPDHPLTSRVTVNRFWQELFGNGIVRSSGDFGISGEQPSHPELLDWLSIEFRESGWDVKKFFKLMVMSNTYRQAAISTPEKLEKDPANKWLSRGPRYRMDAEMVRDNALAVSGLLVRKIGGPSVKPYQPEGVWEAVAMIGSNTRDYKQDTGDKLYRRSMYTFWKRAAPPASMDIFNAPCRETCSVKRERTNTPLQALVTLNDIQFVEAVRHLATNTLRDAQSTDERLDYIAQRLLSRSFRPEEMKLIQASLKQLEDYYTKNEADARKLIAVGESKPDEKLPSVTLATWTMLCNQLMNLDEVLNK